MFDRMYGKPAYLWQVHAVMYESGDSLRTATLYMAEGGRGVSVHVTEMLEDGEEHHVEWYNSVRELPTDVLEAVADTLGGGVSW